MTKSIENHGSKRSGPITDVRVIELGQLIAGPFCGQLLADLGADVIKIEPPGKGDPMREWGQGDIPLWWAVCARNKRCITANLRLAEGQEIVKSLVSQADILIENFRPGTLEKWGLGYDVLSKLNPGLILVRVTGYGQTGPYSKRAGYAAIGEAMAGMRYLTGWPDRPPSRVGLSIGDSLAAIFACNGALAALHHRDKTGEGQVVDSAIYEAVLNIMESTIPEYAVSGHTRERSGSVMPNIAPSNLYRCADGFFLIAANQDTVFGRLCDAMSLPELKNDSRFSSHPARGENQGVLDELIEQWTNKRPVAEIDELMQRHSVPAGKIFRAVDMLEDPHFAHRDAIVDVPSEQLETLKMQNIFPKLSKTPGSIRWAGPEKLGQHNEEVYCDLLGMSEEKLFALRKTGVI